MTKLKSEVVAEAHRRINVLSVDEDVSADQSTYGESAADSLFAELNAEPHNMGFTWTMDTVPEAVFRPLSWLLAVDLATHYVVPSESRAQAMGRVRAYAFPNNIEDRRDVDEDGLISEDEADAGLRALYY